MSFPTDFLDELRTRVSITDLVGRRVSWDRAKSNPRRKDYWACCPFHSEKSPSFHVDETKGFYHCFGCGAHGDIISFVKDMDNLSFIEAIERLAGDAGMRLPERTPEMRAQAEARAGLIEIMEMATVFFEKILMQTSGEKARNYLDGRNLSPKVWETFRLGYAPGHGSALSDHLVNQNITGDQLVEAGLSIKSDRGGLRDRFRDRIIFPIQNAQGKVIAFGGRALSSDAQAKYLNSPETPLFHKGRTLYNIGRARTAAAALSRSDNVHQMPGVVVCEGYMDVIALYVAGITQSVAPLGTAMTEEQILLTWKMSAEPVLCFDGDEAGIKAAERAMDRALPLLKPGHSLAFAVLPTGYDPDDLIQKNGTEAMRAVLKKSVPLIEFLWQREIGFGPFDTPEKRAQLEERLYAAANQIRDDKVQRFYRQALKDKLYQHFNTRRPTASPMRTKQQYGGQYGNAARGSFGNQRSQGVSAALKKSTLAQASRLSGGLGVTREIDLYAERERVLVATILRFPELLDAHTESFADMPLDRPELDKLRCEILEIAASGASLDRWGLRDHLKERGTGHISDQLMGHAARKHPYLMDDRAEKEEAEDNWSHVLALHTEVLSLRREAKEAEVRFQQESTSENWQRLQQVQTQLMQASVIQNGDRLD
jgi:DNA primase